MRRTMTTDLGMKTETWIDKKTWGDGAWQGEPDRVEWIDSYSALPCLALRNPNSGAWCGYVAVPPDHDCYGVDYHKLPGVVHEAAYGQGINYTGSCLVDEDVPERERICHVPKAGHSDDVWWIGFHCDDTWNIGPARDARELASGHKLIRVGIEKYVSFAKVRESCTSLAAALT